MSAEKPTRQEALIFLKKYNKNQHLLWHAYAVEAVMRHFAELFNEEDIEKWGIVGLLHDLDYEMYPQEHCKKVRELLETEGYPEDYIRAVESHGWKLCSDVEPRERMEKILYTIDELTGLITATALMRPSKSILDTELKSVKRNLNKRVLQRVLTGKLLKMELKCLTWNWILSLVKQ